MALAWKLLTLISVLLLPFGMAAAPAAAVPHHSVSTAMGHCPEPPSNGHDKARVAACTMACSAALPAISTRQDDAPLITSAPAEPHVAQQLHGLDPDTATPPPKHF